MGKLRGDMMLGSPQCMPPCCAWGSCGGEEGARDGAREREGCCPATVHGAAARGEGTDGEGALTSLSCSCVLDEDPSSVLTRAPTALEGPAPSGVQLSEPVARSRRNDIADKDVPHGELRHFGAMCDVRCHTRLPRACSHYPCTVCGARSLDFSYSNRTADWSGG